MDWSAATAFADQVAESEMATMSPTAGDNIMGETEAPDHSQRWKLLLECREDEGKEEPG